MGASDQKDYYAILGIAKTATAEEIRQAYRKLAPQHHPDANPGDDAAKTRFQEINQAKEVLLDPAKRRQHDDELKVKTVPISSVLTNNSSLDDVEFDKYHDFNDFLRNYFKNH